MTSYQRLLVIFCVLFFSGLPLVFSAPSSEHDVADALEARVLGKFAAQRVLSEFMTGLGNALQKGGPVYAAAFCNIELPSLTENILKELPEGMRFKRVSYKLRNPANAPDSKDKEALDYFLSERKRTGALPESLLQAGNDKSFRYYQPLSVAPVCLQCHGDKAHFNEELRVFLQKKYPEDEAYGYVVGDFRGLLRINLP
jgi:hypothetical protein